MGGAVGNRIIILGAPGSGKSTFASALQEKTGLPLYHLDNVWWKADRTHISREEFDRRLREILQGERWIIDGNYRRTYEPRFAACDTVIFLDYSEEVCMRGITERIGKSRKDMPWIETELDPELVEMVKNYCVENRPEVYRLIEKYAEKRAVIFETREQSEQWLADLG